MTQQIARKKIYMRSLLAVFISVLFLSEAAASTAQVTPAQMPARNANSAAAGAYAEAEELSKQATAQSFSINRRMGRVTQVGRNRLDCSGTFSQLLSNHNTSLLKHWS